MVTREPASTSRGRCEVFCAKAFLCSTTGWIESERIQPQRLKCVCVVRWWYIFDLPDDSSQAILHSTSLNLKKSSGNWAEAKWREKVSSLSLRTQRNNLCVYIDISVCSHSLTHSLSAIELNQQKKNCYVHQLNWLLLTVPLLLLLLYALYSHLYYMNNMCLLPAV